MIPFFLSFILYLITLFPSVAPYRDTGEMVSAAKTLGIAHPPGYPLYTLLSKVFLITIPWGNNAYKLNILSALAGAATVWIVFLIINKLSESNPESPTKPLLGGDKLHKGSSFYSAALAMLFAASYLQWYLSLVSEMYTLNTLFTASIIFLLYKALQPRLSFPNDRRVIYLTLSAFLFGLGLGSRMDLVMIGAGIPFIFLANKKHFTFQRICLYVLFSVIGFSVFAYLPIRSAHGPLLDWNHPADLSRLWSTLTRKTHGGTLDLVSASYAPGENFSAAFLFYLRHLFTGFAYAGIPLGLLGLYSLYKKQKTLLFITLPAWIFSGPVFIYMANIPPNPHALAILEAHFLMPNLIFFIWIAAGAHYLFILLNRCHSRNVLAGIQPLSSTSTTMDSRLKRSGMTGLFLSLVLISINLFNHYPDLNKRTNFIGYDYSRNILRSLPPGSVCIMKKDVQLFSIWNQQLAELRRTDLSMISQGLAGAGWYQNSWKKEHPQVCLVPLRTADDWGAFVESNKDKEIYFTHDVDYTRPPGYSESPNGLVSRIIKDTAVTPNGELLLKYIYVYRGKYYYPAYREFFTPDLIEDYAKARLQIGLSCMRKRDYMNARLNFSTSLSYQPLFPVAENNIAFTYADEGNYNDAAIHYTNAAAQYNSMLSMADKYRTLTEIKESFAKDLSDVFLSLGVCYEKTDKYNEAAQQYQNALRANPGNAKAYFNTAVLYWRRKEWQQVIENLEHALQINPNYTEAQYYLRQARQRR